MYSLDNIGAGANANIWLYVYGALGIITLYLTSKTIYNLYLHPLRSIPGPFSHRASPIPYLYQTLIGRSSFHAHDLHEKYGPVVRLTPNHLSFTDIRAWKDIYGHRIPPPLPSDSPQQPHDGGHHQSQGENPKSPVHYGFFPDVPPSILEASREEHSLLRKTLSHGFSESSLRSQESRIRRYVDLLMLRLGQQQQKKQQEKVEAVDIAKYYNWITFDVTGDLVFAESFGCLERQEYHPFVGLIVGTIRGSSVLVALNYLGLGFVMTIAWRLGVGKLVGKMRGDLAQKIEKRVEISAKMGGIEVENDLFEGLMRRRVEWGIDMKKLTSNAMVLVIAGSETTATLLSGATSLLLSNPQAMEKLKTEVRSAFSSAEEITIASVNTRLPYLLACLNEALRMYPPVTGSLVRLIAKGGATVAGQVIPEGTMVECAPWAMNHSSSHWEDPWSFTPERFLHHHRDEQEGQGQQEKRDTLEALQAFSVGPRNCIGRNLAYAEMRLILANLIYSFDLRLADERGGWIESQKAYPLWARGPLYVHIEPALK